MGSRWSIEEGGNWVFGKEFIMDLKVIQINLQHSRAASFNIVQLMEQDQCDVVLIQEPWVVKNRICGIKKAGTIFVGCKDEVPRACILVKSGIKCWFLPNFSNRDVSTVLVRGRKGEEIILCSVYMANEDGTLCPPRLVQKLCEEDRKPVIIGGDANAHHEVWGSTDINSRGENLLEFILSSSFYVMNKGSNPTFVTRSRREVLDITLANDTGKELLREWKVLDEASYSDHLLISFVIGIPKEKQEEWRNPRKANWQRFAEQVEKRLNILNDTPIQETDDIEREVNLITRIFTQEFRMACPLRKRGKSKKGGLSPELRKLRSDARKAQRKAYKTNKSNDWDEKRRCLREYKKALKYHNQKDFRDYCEEIDGLPECSRMVKILRSDGRNELGMLRNDDGSYTRTPEEALDLLLDKNFPTDLNHDATWNFAGISTDSLSEEIVTKKKLLKAIYSFKPYKSAGTDRIIPKMIQVTSKPLSSIFVKILRSCLDLCYIPIVWRTANIVFLPKPGKTKYDEAGSFRPVSLTSFLLKTLEKLVIWHLDMTGSKVMHKKQHAYMKGKSTTSALHQLVGKLEKVIGAKHYALVTFLDVEGAFNKASFTALEEGMKNFEVPAQIRNWIMYVLLNRTAEATVKGTTRSKTVGRGCPQGGVLSPRLWNMLIDGLLSWLESKYPEFHCQAYADDVTFMIEGIDPDTLRIKTLDVLRSIDKWVSERGLSLNPQKTDLMMVTHRRKYNMGKLTFNGYPLVLKKEVRYLGVILDSRLSWKPHCELKSRQCMKALQMCRRAVGDTWGLSPQSMRWIYTAIIRPMLFYAAIVWAHKVQGNKYLEAKLTRIQRVAGMMIFGAFRTTPTAAIEKLADLTPVNIRVRQEATREMIRLKKVGLWTTITAKEGHIKKCLEWCRHFKKASMPFEVSSFQNMSRKLYSIEMNSDSEMSHETTGMEEDKILIFTDGSKRNGRAGAGIAIKEGLEWKEEYFALGKHTTINQAEMFALIKASVSIVGDGDVVIATDSKVILSRLGKPETQSGLTLECHNALNYLGDSRSVTLRWVPSHEGIEGNEKADQQAKKGTNALPIGPEPYIPLSDSVIAEEMRRWEKKETLRKWREIDGCRQSKLAIREQKPKDLQCLLGMSRLQLRYTIGALTGHANLGRHQRVMGLHDDPHCAKCGSEEEETPDHHLSTCPAYSLIRLREFGSCTITPMSWVNFQYWKIGKYLTETGRMGEIM